MAMKPKPQSKAKTATKKITKVPSRYNAGASDTKINLPKSGKRTVTKSAGGRVRITKQNSSGRTQMIGSKGTLSYLDVPKRGNVRLNSPKKTVAAVRRKKK